MGSPVMVASWAYICWRTHVRHQPPGVHGYEGEVVILRPIADDAEREVAAGSNHTPFVSLRWTDRDDIEPVGMAAD